LKNFFAIVTISILLSACTTLGPQFIAPLEKTPDVVIDGKQSDLASQGDAASVALLVEDSLPMVELTSDLLFKLLKAEIAYQRGQWQSAFITILALAQQTRDPRLARRATELALNSKQNGEALAAIRLWRELAPNSEEARQYYLGFVLLGENIEEAQPLFAQRLNNAKPQSRGLLIYQIQRLLARAKDKAAAFSMLEVLLAPYLLYPEAHIALAQSALANKDFVRGRKEASIALALKPDSELAARSMMQSTPDKGEAAKFLAAFLLANPNANDVRTAYALLLFDQKQYEKARDEFQVLLKAQPQDLTALFALGVLSMQTGELKNAEDYLTAYLKVLASKPEEERDPTQAIMALAQLAEDRKDLDAALKWLAQIETGDALTGAQIKRAQIFAKRKDLATARKMLAEVKAEGERERVQVIVAEAQILRDATQLAEALQVLQAGLERFPDNTDLLYDSAMVAEKLDRLELMEVRLRKIIEIAPTNQHAYNALGYSLADRGLRLTEAYALVERALALAPEDPFILDSMGWVHFRMGQLKEAEDFLRRAYSRRSDSEIAIHLGEVLWAKGQKEDARNLWRDVAAKDPENDTLKSTLTRLNVQH
jgi:tetratricopeptide (TPR) repeat protein